MGADEYDELPTSFILPEHLRCVEVGWYRFLAERG